MVVLNKSSVPACLLRKGKRSSNEIFYSNIQMTVNITQFFFKIEFLKATQ